MSDFWVVVIIAALAAFLTYLGAPLAERFDVPHRVVSGALQFAAGVIAALVFISLMPPVVRYGDMFGVAILFFIGGALFVFFEYFSARRQAAKPAREDGSVISLGLYVGILVDLIVDGVVIGVGATLTLQTGLLLAIGMAISTLPLAFVTISTAKQQGISPDKRRLLSYLFFACVMAGALLGFLVLQHTQESLRLLLIALACGFLITTVTQSMIPEANKEGEPSFAGIFFVGGMSLYGLLSYVLK